MDKKTTNEKEKKERGEQSDKREPGSWTSAVVISGDLSGVWGRSHISNVPVIWMGWEWEGGGGICFFVICHSTKNVHGNYKQTSQ